MKLQYIQVGDYLIPALKGPTPLAHPLSKVGRMYQRQMQQDHPLLFNEMVMTNTWTEHLQEIDETANRRIEQLMPKLAKEAGATEALKASDLMQWVGLMNNIKAQAEEIVLSKLIFDKVTQCLEACGKQKRFPLFPFTLLSQQRSVPPIAFSRQT